MNEILLLLSALVCFSLVLVFYRFFGKIGVFVWICIAMLISNTVAVKLVTFFGLSVTLGNVSYASTFLATDILTELYGKKEANRTVMIGFLALAGFVGVIQLALLFSPAESDYAQQSLKDVFSLAPRISLASAVTYLLMQRFDIWLYSAIRAKTGDKRMWLRNNAATLVSQLFDSALFNLLAFAGVYSWKTLSAIILATYLIKALLALLDTPFLYIAKRIKQLD